MKIEKIKEYSKRNMFTDETTPKLATWTDVVNIRGNQTLKSFSEMWSYIFLWSLISSIFVHTCAALVAFVTLRKHKFGRYFPLLLLLMGVVPPAICGIVSSAAIAFVHRVSSLQMLPVYALVWGIGQTIVSAFVGYTRILATL